MSDSKTHDAAQGMTAPGPDLTQFEDQFRTLVEQAANSLRGQSDAFDSIMNVAIGAINDRSALIDETAALKSAVETITAEKGRLENGLQASKGDCIELRSTKEQLQTQLSELEAACRKVKEELETSGAENNRLVAANRALEDEVTTVTEAYEKTGRELTTVRQSLQSQLAEVTATSQSLGTRVESLETSNQDLLSTRERLEKELDSTTTRAKDLQTQVEELDDERARLESDKASLSESIRELQTECEALKTHAEAADGERSRLLSTRQTLEAALSDISASSGETKALVEAEREVETLAARVKELETQMTELESNADAGASEQVAALQERIAELEVQPTDEELAPLQERITELEQALANADENGVVADAVGVGNRETILRDLALHMKSATGIAAGLQQPKLGDHKRETLTRAASSLAAHLDVLRSTIELTPPVGTLELTSEPMNPEDALQAVMQGANATATTKAIELIKRVDAAVPDTIVTDGTRLRQVLGWAMGFMMRHAVSGEVTILVSLASGGRDLSVHLINGGAGLLPDEVKAIVTGSRQEVAMFGLLTEALGGRLRVDFAGHEGFAVRLSVATNQLTGTKEDRRGDDRIYQELLDCNLGKVIDLSPSGIRVVSERTLKGRTNVELTGPDGPMKLRAFVVWSNRITRKRFEIGLRFMEIQPDQVEQVNAIAEEHGIADSL